MVLFVSSKKTTTKLKLIIKSINVCGENLKKNVGDCFYLRQNVRLRLTEYIRNHPYSTTSGEKHKQRGNKFTNQFCLSVMLGTEPHCLFEKDKQKSAQKTNPH